MKKTLLFISCFLFAVVGYPQGFFNQNGGMIKKAIEQIELLGTYYLQAKNGYQIVDNGLKKIKNIKSGEFDLHDRYYNSLRSVNPNIKGFCKVEEAIRVAEAVAATAKRGISNLNQAPWLDAAERRYLHSVFSKLLEDTDKDVQALSGLLTNGSMQLTDDERIRRILLIAEELNRKSIFLQRFSINVTYLVQSRAGEYRDGGHIGKLHYK